MMFHPRVAQTTILATGSALALMTVALGDHAHAEGKLDASHTISFARIRVGDIAATGVFGESEYAISARGRVGGIMKLLAPQSTLEYITKADFAANSNDRVGSSRQG